MAPGAGEDVRGLLARLTIRRRDEAPPEAATGLAIEAPPEAATGLAALFEGMGRLLREAGAGR